MRPLDIINPLEAFDIHPFVLIDEIVLGKLLVLFEFLLPLIL